MQANVFQAGTIELATNAKIDKNQTSHSGALAAYEFSSAEKMHERASKHNWVVRPNGKKIKGAAYTLKMAQNDFRNA